MCIPCFKMYVLALTGRHINTVNGRICVLFPTKMNAPPCSVTSACVWELGCSFTHSSPSYWMEGWSQAVRCKLRSLHPRWKGLWQRMVAGLNALKKTLFPVLGIETRFLGRPSRSVVSILTELLRLVYSERRLLLSIYTRPHRNGSHSAGFSKKSCNYACGLEMPCF